MSANKIILFVAFVLFAYSCGPKGGKLKNTKEFFIDNTPLVLNGNVKQVTIAQDFDGNPNSGQDYDIVDLNERGIVIKIIHGFHGAVLQTTYATKYNVNNKKTEVIEYLIIPKKSFIKSKDSIDANNKIYTDKDSIGIVSGEYYYNADNQIYKRISKLNDSGTDTFTYNKVGDMVEYDEYLSPKLIFEKFIYKYDDKHHLIESYSYTNGNRNEEITYEYKSFDTHNNWVEAVANSSALYGSFKKSVIITRKITYY